MIILLAIAFIMLYGGGLYVWIRRVNWQPEAKILRYLRLIHYAFLVLALSALLLHYLFGIQYRGIWTTPIFLVGLVITGILLFPLGRKSIRNAFEKIYFMVFAALPIAVAGILLVPFFGVIIILSLWGHLVNPVSKIHYEDTNLRIQSSFTGVLGPSQLHIVEKTGLFEKSHYRSITHDQHFDSLLVQYNPDATRIIFKTSNKYLDPEHTVIINAIK